MTSGSETLRDRIRAGAAWLDTNGPENWRDIVVINRLNLGSPCRCVLGQVFTPTVKEVRDEDPDSVPWWLDDDKEEVDVDEGWENGYAWAVRTDPDEVGDLVPAADSDDEWVDSAGHHFISNRRARELAFDMPSYRMDRDASGSTYSYGYEEMSEEWTGYLAGEWS